MLCVLFTLLYDMQENILRFIKLSSVMPCQMVWNYSCFHRVICIISLQFTSIDFNSLEHYITNLRSLQS